MAPKQCAIPRSSLRERREKKINHKGWLMKRGPCQGWDWEKRFCVLTEEELVFYMDENDSDDPSKRKGEIYISEYTKAIEFRKADAPGEAAKFSKDKPYGFVVDSEPYGGKNRKGFYYLAADNNESMNKWIVDLYKASKAMKNLAPTNRTSLADFVALWDAPLILASAPEIGEDRSGSVCMSVPAICQSVLAESSRRARRTIDGGGVLATMGGWFTSATQPDQEDPAFPLHKYFSIAADFAGNYDFGEAGVASSSLPENLTENSDERSIIEKSFSFCRWLGVVFGTLLQALVAAGDRVIPPVDQEIDTRIGKMCQSGAQGLFVSGSTQRSEKEKPSVRVAIVVTIDGGPSGFKENVQKKHIPAICKEVIEELKKQQYPWAHDAWIVWCHFPLCEDFIKSLAGYRNLVPDNNTANQLREDDQGKPTTYTVHRMKRQPNAPSLLGEASVDDLMVDAKAATVQMIEDILSACDTGNLKQVKSILDGKCNVNVKDDGGVTPLSVAAGTGSVEIVNELLSRKADVNAFDGEGDSILTVAVGEGFVDVCKILVANGADTKMKVSGQWLDKPDETVSLIEVAEHRGFKDVADYLSSLKDEPAAPPVKPAASRASRANKKNLPTSLADELAGVD